MSSRIINILLFLAASAISMAAQKPFTLVIDPGHGGKDYGCIGTLTNEKTIVLDVGLRLGKILKAEHPEVKQLFTRATDVFIPLSDRASMANKASADLFISIHVNSVDKKTKGREKITGAQVYTLGLHRTDDNLAVAMRENSVIELENDFSETYHGFDPSSTESYIIFELTQNRHMQQSLEVAEDIQKQLVNGAGRFDKGVLQSGFLVLRATSMPAVLVELDFICNPEAEKFLASEEGREKCARAIADAFATYLARRKQDVSAAAQSLPIAEGVVNGDDVVVDLTQVRNSEAVAYSVQIASLANPVDPATAFPGVKDVIATKVGEATRYSVGRFKSLKDAKKRLSKLKKSYPEAFVIKLTQ